MALRFVRRWGPRRIAYHLRLARSTVENVLRRFRMPLLSRIDKLSGLPVRKDKPTRYEHPEPGDLVHVDIKKLGRISDGGGHRALGRRAGRKNRSGAGRLHLPPPRGRRPLPAGVLGEPARRAKETAAGFWERANAFFAEHGITVRRVLTDNGSCYRSHAFKSALGPDIAHKRTRPYRPQTNGKVCEDQTSAVPAGLTPAKV